MRWTTTNEERRNASPRRASPEWSSRGAASDVRVGCARPRGGYAPEVTRGRNARPNLATSLRFGRAPRTDPGLHRRMPSEFFSSRVVLAPARASIPHRVVASRNTTPKLHSRLPRARLLHEFLPPGDDIVEVPLARRDVIRLAERLVRNRRRRPPLRRVPRRRFRGNRRFALRLG